MITKKIVLKHDRNYIKEITVQGSEYFLNNSIQDIYQNDDSIKNIIMENTATQKRTIGVVGCRFIMGIRMINYMLHKLGLKQLTVKEIDDIADSGGWKNDAWSDGYYKNKEPIENVINFNFLIEKINKLKNITLIYNVINSKIVDNRNILLSYIMSDIPLGIKMKNLFSKKYDSHFINVDNAFLDLSGDLYFRMKETYKDYNGYNGCYVKYDIPGYYEVIY